MGEAQKGTFVSVLRASVCACRIVGKLPVVLATRSIWEITVNRTMPLNNCAVGLLLILVGGCVSTGSQVADSGWRWEFDESYTISNSLFPSDQNLLSNEAIDEILGGTIALPVSAHLAVLPIGRRPDIGIADDLFSSIEESERVDRVSYLPWLLVPRNATMSHLRESAARYQANLLFIYRDTSSTYTNYRFAARDEVRAYSTVEAILLDVRTGIVPFSTLISEEHTLRESSDDFGSAETRRRAHEEAFRLALSKAVIELKDFLKSVP